MVENVQVRESKIVPVLLPIPTERAYSYAVPQNFEVCAGAIVQVPLGGRLVFGVVWDGATDNIDPKKLKTITKVFDCPPLDKEMRQFIDWVADYTLSPKGLIAAMALRAPAAFDEEPEITCLELSHIMPEKMTLARQKIIAFIKDKTITRSQLSQQTGTSLAIIDGLIKIGVLRAVQIAAAPLFAPLLIEDSQKKLSEQQQYAVEQLAQTLSKPEFSVTLIDGVTGSGKTEVYFEAVAQILKTGKQVLILLPEIALTQAFLKRFEQRFGTQPAQWHADITPKMREKVWRQVNNGLISVVVGARSALFLPFKNLGLIVVDEEHDQAFKQEERIFYHARDMAIVRGRISKFPIILASATPSIESQVNANLGRYKRIKLEHRYAHSTLPLLQAVDMRRDPPQKGGFLSPVLLKAMNEKIALNEQSLLFLNRRGYAPLTLCRVCGHRFSCKDCSAWLVEHRFKNKLMCHQCGHDEKRPDACPTCGTFDHLAACGPGIERIAEEVKAHFPKARTLILSSDTMGGIKELRAQLQKVAHGDVDIIIGTQLVAKGHNFPHLTLVGVVDADLGLTSADPRAYERTFQILSQVTGRAGRFGKASQGLIQTFQSEHHVIQALISGDREAFFEREINARNKGGLPPFARLVALIISSSNANEAQNHARILRATAPSLSGIEIFGPAPSPIFRLRGRYRFRLMIKANREISVQNFIRQMLDQAPKPHHSVLVQIDVDPQSFL